MKKIILLITSYIIILNPSFSQEIVWQNTIGGSSGDLLYSIQQTSDGGYILGGGSWSNISGDKTENRVGDCDYWIMKTDSVGNIQWQNTIGGNQEDRLYSIEQTNDGGYILGGRSNSYNSGDKTENPIGSYDYWIVKTDASGNIQWQNTIGGTSYDEFKSIHQTADGGYIIGGFSSSDISGDKTESNVGAEDYWIVKIDSSGNILWQNTIGGNVADYIHSIQQTTDGGYILGGFSYSSISGDKTENSWNNSNDYWVVKIDASGNIQWQNTIGGTDDDRLYSIKQTSDGGYILAGVSFSDISGDKTETHYGAGDYWLVKINGSGNILWQNAIGGSSYDEFQSVIQTSDGGYLLGGFSLSNISGDKTENSIGMDDYWVVNTDAWGNIQWENTIGGNAVDRLYSVQQTNDSCYILAGHSNSNISNDKTENSLGNGDYWILKLTETFNLIKGKLFIDANSNLVQDAGEADIIHRKITELNSGGVAFSHQNGLYNLVVLDSGSFTVSPSAINYYNGVPANHSAYFNGIHQTDSLNDFAFQPTGVFNDLCITITPMGNFRANMNASYMINYENIGTTTLNGTVIFSPDNDVTFISSNVTPTSITTDSVVWNVGTLTPFQTGNILVTIHVNAGTPIGTLINSSVEIEPVAGDANTACNYNSWEVFVTGAVDPNAILVDRDTVLTTELSSPPYLNYIIYFQNTGNDTAFNISVLNNIPLTLDESTFEFIASSHPMNITYGAHARLMEFTFDNILLPDSNVNEPASHGFIRYRIKPKTTLVAGDEIQNTAYIYFDFNQPVMTNTAVTEIVLPTGAEEAAAGSGSKQLIAYPNPVRDELIVNCYSLTGKNAEVKIYDLFGREVFQLLTRNQEPETKINVSGFSQGIYLIQLKSGEKTARSKFVKQ